MYFSPGIAAGLYGGYLMAYSGWSTGNGCLMTADQTGAVRDRGLGMMTDTSASIAAVPGGYQIAFQAYSGHRSTYGDLGTLDLGFEDVAVVQSGDLAMAGTQGSKLTNLVMTGQPRMASLNGSYQVAFQAKKDGRPGTTGIAGTRYFGSPQQLRSPAG